MKQPDFESIFNTLRDSDQLFEEKRELAEMLLSDQDLDTFILMKQLREQAFKLKYSVYDNWELYLWCLNNWTENKIVYSIGAYEMWLMKSINGYMYFKIKVNNDILDAQLS